MTIRRHSSRWGTRHWLETAAISAVVPLVSLQFRPADPFWVAGAVPWLLLLPLLCGAQYGRASGALSAALLASLAFARERLYGHGSWQLLAEWSSACLSVGIVAGQFRDAAERRRSALREQVLQLSEAVQRAQRSALVLKRSHARLAERLAPAHWSLAGSLEAAARSMQVLTSERALGEVLLEVLASQALLQAASLFWLGSRTSLPVRLASLGEQRGASQLHPLVLRALRTGRLAAVGDPARVRDAQDSSVLVAVPLVTSREQVVGVVAIHQLPFMAFQTEHLRDLLMIAGRLADLMRDRVAELANAPTALSAPKPRLLQAPAPLGRRAQNHGPRALPNTRSVAAHVFESPR